MQGNALALSPDALALLLDALTLQPDALALLLNALTLFICVNLSSKLCPITVLPPLIPPYKGWKQEIWFPPLYKLRCTHIFLLGAKSGLIPPNPP
jgi:hypothetical protein